MPSDRPGNTPFTPDNASGAATLAATMLAHGIDRKAVLTHLAYAAEKLVGPNATASILVLDEGGALRNGASPNLPADYLAAIDGIKPDPKVGTCAAAAATGNTITTPDFFADDKWAELRHLPLSLGYVGAWSVPIKAPDGRVQGTFGIYLRTYHSPAKDELAYIESLARAASITLSR